MQTWWRGSSRGNGMLGDQQSQRIVDPTFGFRVMSIWKLHENVVQGHLVTLSPRVKNQMKQQDYMSLSSTGVYGQCRYWNTTKSGTVEGFADLTHQCERCIEGN